MAGRQVFREKPLPGDGEAVARLVEGTGFFRPDEITVAVELVEEYLNKGPSSGYNFIFVEGISGALLGYVCYGLIPCTLGSYDLYWIVVDKRSQGQGLGKNLIARTEEMVRRLGGRNMYIETSGKAKYLPTRSFYRKCGYLEAARLPGFYEHDDDKIIFSKNVRHPET